MKINDELRDNAVKLSYKLIDDLLYFDDNEKKLRLCIPFAIKTKFFKLAHDEMRYLDYAYTHKRFI